MSIYLPARTTFKCSISCMAGWTIGFSFTLTLTLTDELEINFHFFSESQWFNFNCFILFFLWTFISCYINLKSNLRKRKWSVMLLQGVLSVQLKRNAVLHTKCILYLSSSTYTMSYLISNWNVRTLPSIFLCVIHSILAERFVTDCHSFW